MKKITMKNFSDAEVLSNDELKKIMGGKKAPVQCKIAGGLIVDCYATAVDCIDILFGEGQTVEGCWETTPLPGLT